MPPLPTIRLDFAGMPFWQGVQDAPGKLIVRPLSLSWDERGFISQTSPDAVRDTVLNSYASSDYQFITPPPGSSEWANRQGNENIEDVESALRNLAGARVLEIGAGTLYIAQKLAVRHKTSRYVVVDPAIPIDCDTGGADISVSRSFFPCDSLKGETFDSVISFNCLEHVDDPIKFLGHIRAVLDNDQSRAFLVFPDVERALLRGDVNAILHEHMSYFSENMLPRIFAAAGLRIISVDRRLDAFKVVVARGEVVESLSPMSDLLPKAAVSLQTLFVSTGDMVADALSRGKRVLFHGATHGLNTFLYLTGQSEADNIVIVDSDSSKVGRYLPACRSPIVEPDISHYRDADLVYVSALTFFDEISARMNSEFGVPLDRIRPLSAHCEHR